MSEKLNQPFFLSDILQHIIRHQNIYTICNQIGAIKKQSFNDIYDIVFHHFMLSPFKILSIIFRPINVSSIKKVNVDMITDIGIVATIFRAIPHLTA